MVDIRSLEEEFDVEEVRTEYSRLRERVRNLDQYEDPNEVLRQNIERANALLDRIEEAIDVPGADAPRGGLARLVEVAAKLIDSVTTAANSMMSVTFNNQEQEYKTKVLSLKELEVQAKLAAQPGAKAITNQTNNTLIVTSDRNSLLDMLKGGTEEHPIPLDISAIDIEQQN